MMNTTWATKELLSLRNDSDYETERVLLEINELIVARMDAMGLRKVDVAQRLGVSRAFVTKLLNGNRNITLATLVKVANVLGAQVDVPLAPRPDAGSLDRRRKAMYENVETGGGLRPKQ